MESRAVFFRGSTGFLGPPYRISFLKFWTQVLLVGYLIPDENGKVPWVMYLKKDVREGVAKITMTLGTYLKRLLRRYLED